MANVQFSKYGKGIDLQDHSSSYSSNAGAIFLSSSYLTFRSDFYMNSSSITDLHYPENAQDAANKEYVDQKVAAGNDLSVQADSGGLLTVDLADDDFNVLGSANECVVAGAKAGNEVTFTVGLRDDVNVTQNLYVGAAFGVSGSTTLGNAAADVVTVTGQLTASQGADFTLVTNHDAGISTTGLTASLGISGSSTAKFGGNLTVGPAAYGLTTAGALTVASMAANWTNAGRTVADLGTITTVDINGGTADALVIGGSSQAAGKFTTISGSSTLKSGGNFTVGAAAYGLTTAGALDIASMAANWTNAGRTVADLGTITTVDLNGGTVDGTIIGGASAAAGTFTTLSASSTVKCGGNLTVGDDDYGLTTAGALDIASMAANWTNAGRTVADMGIVTTMDLNGGTIDGTIIGGASAAAGTFAAVVATSLDNSDGNITNVGDIDCDSISPADSANGLEIQFAGVTATNKIELTDNLAEALTIEVEGDDYIKFATTNGSELITFGENSTFAGTTIASLGTVTTMDLNGGSIDGTTIGAASAAAGTFAAVVGTTISGTVGSLTSLKVNSTIGTAADTDLLTLESGQLDIAGVVSGSGNADFGGNLRVGAAQYGLTSAGALDIASMAANWTNAGRTVADMGIVTTMDLNGGTIDGTIIGGASAAAGTFAALVGTSLNCSDGNITNVGSIACDSIAPDAAGTGLDIDFTGNTGTNLISLTDNLASALDVTQGSDSYLKFVTTNSSEHVLISENLELEADMFMTGAMYVNGNIELPSDHDVTARSYITYSDAALKENIETVTNAMDMIQGLRGVSYDLKDGGRREFGFIAQEVNTVVPEVVHTSGDMMGIDYTRITSLLVEAVKTQQAEIEALKNKLDK